MFKNLLLLTFAFLLPLGCRNQTELPIRDGMVIASGTVKWNGLLLPHGRISFIRTDTSVESSSAESTDGVVMSSITNGTFEVEISPGTYRVEFRQFESPPGSEETGAPAVQVLPSQYNEKSKITITISDKGSRSLEFVLDGSSS